MLDASTLETLLKDSDDFYWGGLAYSGNGKRTIEVPVVVEVVDSDYGSEGDWEKTVYVVIKVGDKYFKKTGYYASHAGTDWDGPVVEVKPVQRTVDDWAEV